MKFVADTMLEKLARWLRILGYDVIYSSSKNLSELVNIANNEERIFLTRRKSFPENINPTVLYDICSENFDEQMIRIIKQFNLDFQSNLFTRCSECNVEVISVTKDAVKNRVPQKSWEGFNEFYECPNCKKVFWKGAHITNTMKKLNSILDKKL